MRAVDGAAPETGIETQPRVLLKWPSDWCRDQDRIAYTAFSPRTGYDVWVRSGDDRGAALVTTPRNEAAARFSPRGEWIAYESDDFGVRDVYCRATSGGVPYRISRDGGLSPCWSADGPSLFYRTPAGQVVRVAMPPGDAPRSESWFTEPDLLSFDVDPKGTRVLCCVQSAGSVPSELTIVLNWTEWLRSNR